MKILLIKQNLLRTTNTIGSSFYRISILNFSIIELISKLNSSSTYLHHICFWNCHVLFAWIIYHTDRHVLDYVLYWGYVASCMHHLHLTIYLLQGIWHFGSSTQTMWRKEVALSAVSLSQWFRCAAGLLRLNKWEQQEEGCYDCEYLHK